MNDHYDAIVVGARCAGSPTAMLLARKGYRVLLIDRAEFPSDTISSHYMHQPGVARLEAWGLLDALRASGCPPTRRLRFDVGSFALEGAPPPADGVREGFAPRRFILDKILVDAAVSAGAEMRQGFTVTGLVWDGERVVGIEGHDRVSERSIRERARLVVGADGRHSTVARLVGASEYGVTPPLTCAYYAYWSGLPLAGAEIYSRPGLGVLVGPTHHGHAVVQVFWPHAAFHQVRTDVEANYLRALEATPALLERVREAHREEPFRGAADLTNFLRMPCGPGWALVGDAGFHKDPIMGHGIMDAFRDAQLLADGVDAGLSGRLPLHDALALYAHMRDIVAVPSLAATVRFARLSLPPEIERLLPALRGRQEEIDRFFGTLAGTIAPQLFYSDDNLKQLMAAAPGV